MIARMTEHSTVLSKGRKKRAMPATLATPEDVSGFGLLGTHPLHKTSKARSSGPHVDPGSALLQSRNGGTRWSFSSAQARSSADVGSERMRHTVCASTGYVTAPSYGVVAALVAAQRCHWRSPVEPAQRLHGFNMYLN